MKNEARKAKVKDENGYAMFEGLVFMMAFVVLAIYVFDSFAAIHTGITNSIGARTYLFETLEHRANIRFNRFVDEGNYNSEFDFAAFNHQRFHTVNDEDQPPSSNGAINAVGRRLTQADGERENMVAGSANANGKTPVIYVKEGYGICIDSACPGGS
jgi:hypothetical protein